LLEVGKGIENVGDDVTRSRELADLEHVRGSRPKRVHVFQQRSLRFWRQRACQQVQEDRPVTGDFAGTQRLRWTVVN
jgi:hypothetical protein